MSGGRGGGLAGRCLDQRCVDVCGKARELQVQGVRAAQERTRVRGCSSERRGGRGRQDGDSAEENTGSSQERKQDVDGMQ
eukprot:2025256-Rhodomonas_salina.1